MTEEQLVEKIMLAGLGTIREDMARKLLSVVKQHVGVIATSCNVCKGTGEVLDTEKSIVGYSPCERCLSVGVVPRNDNHQPLGKVRGRNESSK